MDPYTMRKLGFTDYADKEGGYKYKFFDDGKCKQDVLIQLID